MMPGPRPQDGHDADEEFEAGRGSYLVNLQWITT